MVLRDEMLEIFESWEDASPVDKVMKIVKLRSLFSKATLDEGLDAIRACTEEWQLNILLGVGMKGLWYSAVVTEKGKMQGL